MHVRPPPSAPPKRTEEEHSVLAIGIICAILVPAGAFLVYLHFTPTYSPTAVKRTPYAQVKKDDGPVRKTAEISFKFQM